MCPERSWKMEGSQTNEKSPWRSSDAFAQPFHLLGVDPSATSERVQEAYALARERGVTSAQALAEARDSILDPERRLSSELSYPLDSFPEEAAMFFAQLSGDISADELVGVAHQLPPLSRANFIAHHAARQPSNDNLLVALVEAHASIDATETYATLKTLRYRAGLPTPSLVSVGQGLDELTTPKTRQHRSWNPLDAFLQPGIATSWRRRPISSTPIRKPSPNWFLTRATTSKMPARSSPSDRMILP
jgi:hypothetical protein